MLSNEQRQLIRDFAHNLEDRPLEPTDDFYYAFLETTNDDPIAVLVGQIAISQSQSVSLFTGQIGSGKSTELRRLRKTLTDEGCVVFLLDMRDYMNLYTTVEINDFLISIMAALSEAVEQQFHKSPANRGYLERLGEVLTTEIIFKNEFDISGIKASLRDDPDFKKRLQEHLRGHVVRISKDAHAFAQDVVTLIRNETGDNNKKVVLLIDSVERLTGVGVEGANEVYNSVVNLFSAHANSLQIPMLHIVYTIPPYLTALAQGIRRRLGSNMLCSLPSVHVQQTRQNLPDNQGLAIMREIVGKRCGRWAEIFTEEQLDKLALASGGEVRDFFRLIRNCLIKTSAGTMAGIPIQDTIIQQSINALRREMLPIAKNDKLKLIEIHQSFNAELDDIEKLPTLARFLDNKLVLNYRNGDDWYDVHPLIRDEIER